jgi:uncharacterized DUF497 family protein
MLCIYILRYEWDEEKNQRNQRKHGGISFELAALVFEDERCLVCKDRIDERTGEQRWIALGMAQPAADAAILLVVAHVYREDEDGEEIVRIISAREAEKRDVQRYQAQALDEG